MNKISQLCCLCAPWPHEHSDRWNTRQKEVLPEYEGALMLRCPTSSNLGPSIESPSGALYV
jgi:hypothetical protein